MSVLNWIRFDQNLTWAQANAVALMAGGRLLIDDHDLAGGANWASELADAMDRSEQYENPSWFGISAIAAGGYQWVDGRTVDPARADARFGPGGDPNADADPDNDTRHPVISGSRWASDVVAAPDGVTQAFVEYVNTRSVLGTAYDDAIFGGAGPGESVRTYEGDDIWIGTGGGKVYLGPGDDLAVVRELEFSNPWVSGDPVDGTLIYDGPGRDRVEAEGGVVRAAIDGDDDQFLAQRVTYTDAVGDLVVTRLGPAEAYLYLATGAGVGEDQITASEIVGGSGDDHIEGVGRIQGGPGDDYLAPEAGPWPNSPFAQGDAGNDTLVASTPERAELRGGYGDDTLIFLGPATASGGPGDDLFVMQATVEVTLNDFGGGDRLDLTALTDQPVAEMFENGVLKLESVKGGYTLLFLDPDGGGDAYTPLVTFKGPLSEEDLLARLAGEDPPEPPLITDAWFSAALPAFGAIRLVSTAADGTQANDASLNPQISDDGRYVTFESYASNLVAGDTNDQADLFRKDLVTGEVTRIAENSGGGDYFPPTTTPDGRYSFQIRDGLGPDLGDWRIAPELVRVDSVTGQTLLVSASAHGQAANSRNQPEFQGASDDGRFVLFYSNADNLVPGDSNYGYTDLHSPVRDYFVKDMVTGEIVLVSGDAAGNEIPLDFDPGGSRSADISGDGRWVVFTAGPGLVPGDANGADDIFLVDVQALRAGLSSAAAHLEIENPAGTPLTVSIPQTTAHAAASLTTPPATHVTADLPFNLTHNGPWTSLDIQVAAPGGGADSTSLIVLSTVEESGPFRVYTNAHGRELHSGENLAPQISADGRLIVFTGQLNPTQLPDVQQVFVLNWEMGETTIISTTSETGPGDADSYNPRISPDGHFVEFASDARNLVAFDPTLPRDPTTDQYLFRRDMVTGEIVQIPAYTLPETGQLQNGVQVTFTTSRWIDDNHNRDHIQLQDLFIAHPDQVHTLTGSPGNELLQGGPFGDRFDGAAGRDLLLGAAGNDTLNGGDEDDQLVGGPGADQLTGGQGDDRFILIQPADGADVVADFTPGEDRLVIAAQMFGADLAPAIEIGSDPAAGAPSGAAVFLYDTDDGRLWFDPDGSGGETATLLATLSGAPAVTAGDFLLV